MASKPTHEQAQLHLQIYEQRREPRLRQARDWFFANCFADTLDEALRIAPPGTEAGTNFMMVISYWDMVAGIVNRGLINDELFFDSNGEIWVVWDRMRSIVPTWRAAFKNPHLFENIENTCKRLEVWREKRAPGSSAAMRRSC